MLGRFTCTIHQLLIRSSCFVENNLLLIQGFQVSVYSLKSVSPPLCIETSSSPLFSPLFLFLIPLSPHSSFQPSSSPPSFLTPLFTPLPQPPLSSPSSSPLVSSLVLTPSLLNPLLTPPPHPGQLQVLWFLSVWTKTLLENKTLYSYQLHVLSILDYNELPTPFSPSPSSHPSSLPSLSSPLFLIPLSPHPSSHPSPSPPSLLTSLLTPRPHPPLSSPSFSPLLLTPSLLTPLLTPPPHPGLSSPSSSSLLLTHSLLTPLLTPPPHPGQLQVLWFLSVWTKTLLENKTLYSYQLHVLSILDYNELICHF